jgi:CBS domain-containing protein
MVSLSDVEYRQANLPITPGALEERTMTVGQVMTFPVEVVHPSDTVRTAAEEMRALNVGSIPVCEGDKPVGVVTDRDLVVRGLALGHDPDTLSVSEVMSDVVQSCRPDTPIEEAARLMKEHQIRRLVVVDDDQTVVGVVSLGDLARDASEQLAGETLEAISEPSPPFP